jgi:hypothetical protein
MKNVTATLFVDEKRPSQVSLWVTHLKGIGDHKQVSRTIQLVKQEPICNRTKHFKAQEEIWKLKYFTM